MIRRARHYQNRYDRALNNLCTLNGHYKCYCKIKIDFSVLTINDPIWLDKIIKHEELNA